MRKKVKYLIYTDYFRLTGLKYNLKQRIKLLFHPGYGGIDGFRLMRCYRLANGSKGLMKKHYKHKYYRMCKKYGVEIPLSVKIGKGCIIWHTVGIVLHMDTVIGDNCTILQQVTVGTRGKDPSVAKIGDCCSIGAGAKIIGPVTIGHHVSIGANAVVTHDLPDMCTSAGVPAKILRIKDEYVDRNVNYLSFEEWLKRKGRK